jgi:hypothetical protein
MGGVHTKVVPGEHCPDRGARLFGVMLFGVMLFGVMRFGVMPPA